MALIYTDEQNMLRDAARGYLDDAAPIAVLRQLRDACDEAGFSTSAWSGMGEMGWAGVLIGEDHGGVEMGMTAAGILLEEMGKSLSASPFLASSVVAATGLSASGTTTHQENWLPKIASGEAVVTLACDEGRHHAPYRVKTSAKRSGNGFVLSGEKSFVLEGATADALIISARTSGEEGDQDGISLFIVPQGASGVSVTCPDMIDCRQAATVTLTDVQVDADALLGEVDQGAPLLTKMLNAGRLGIAAELTGATQECLNRTVTYLQERDQFGAKIGTFQSLQHRASHLYTELELSKSIVLQALHAFDAEKEDAPLMVAAAKAKLGQVAQLAAQEAVQMHGGIGMTDEFDIGFFMKRARVADRTFGDHRFHTDAFAKMRGY